MIVVLLASLWIGALIVALFVQADELRRCRRALVLCRRALVACRDNHRDYGEAF
jgi:hypothetical protein